MELVKREAEMHVSLSALGPLIALEIKGDRQYHRVATQNWTGIPIGCFHFPFFLLSRSHPLPIRTSSPSPPPFPGDSTKHWHNQVSFFLWSLSAFPSTPFPFLCVSLKYLATPRAWYPQEPHRARNKEGDSHGSPCAMLGSPSSLSPVAVCCWCPAFPSIHWWLDSQYKPPDPSSTTF